MKHTRFSFLPLFLLMVLISLSTTSARADNNEVKSLGEILNPQEKNNTLKLSPIERGNFYYENCMQTESLAFDKNEKETLCTCTAAKMTNLLTNKEFSHLYKDSKEGSNARMKVITYAYTGCMNYVIEKKIRKDCATLPFLDTVFHGKKQVCACAVNQYNELMSKAAPEIFMDAIKYDPMTLNPLEHYFTSDAYYYNVKRYAKACRTKLLYEKK